MSVSILILTKDEEVSLPGCLESVSWANDIVVFDSFSSDRTEAIARQAGARFIQRRFDDFASQRNAALNEVDYSNSWIFMLDADERVSDELREEIQALAGRPDDGTTLYRVRRKDYLFGRWLRRSTGYPTWFGRLVKRGHITVNRKVNEEYHTDGGIGYLQGHLIHYPFIKGVAHWFSKHNTYSSMEAEALSLEVRRSFAWRELFDRDPAKRRRAQKQLAFRLPFRPGLVFCYFYFFRLGCFDGWGGLTYSYLRSVYESMIDLKMRELARRAENLPI